MSLVPPMMAPDEAMPSALIDAELSTSNMLSEALSKPYRLGLAGLGVALGLFVRLAAANGVGDLNSRPMMLLAAATSAIVGFALVLIAAERDRFGASLGWIAAVTAGSWGALNWMSPPFADSVTVWSKPDQAVLALVGIGNGLLLAGLVVLAFVRRLPTLTVAATMFAGTAVLAANSVLLREQWPAILALGAAFALVLLAWDRSPRRERKFVAPEDAPRVSRAALSFFSVALCGTALQLWVSRTDIPRALPAVAASVVLIGAAFASLIRVRREIERRETTLSEWTSWMREIRTNDFRAEMANFESPSDSASVPEPRRELSFPNLSIHEDPSTDVAVAAEPAAAIAPAWAEPDTSDGDAAPLDELVPHADPIEPTDAPSIQIPTDEPADTAGTPSILIPTDEPADTAGTPSILIPTDEPADSSSIQIPTQEPAEVALPVALPPTIDLPQADQALTSSQVAAAPVETGISLPTADTPAPIEAPVPVATGGGAFSAMVAATPSRDGIPITDLAALGEWLTAPGASARVKPLLVAIEALTLDEFESLPPEDATYARDEIGGYLADAMPTADLVAWIDGPYFIVAHDSQPDAELLALNKLVLRKLRPTDGVLAFLRPGPEATLDEIVDEAVMGLLQARRMHTASTR